jgi:hypothetical protein
MLPAIHSGAPPSPEELRNQNEEAWRRSLAEHDVEARAGWAAAKERDLTAALASESGSLHFVFRSVDCREKTCLATVEFPSFDAAVRQYERVLPLGREDHPCPDGVSVLLPEPSRPQDAYRVSYLYTCAP